MMPTFMISIFPVLSKNKIGPIKYSDYCRSYRCRPGFVFIELVVVFAIIALMIGLVVTNTVDRVRRTRIDDDIFRFAHALRTAVAQAVLTNQEYVVVLDVTDGDYVIYQTDEKNKYDPDQEALVPPGRLEISYIEQVDFPDGTHQYSGELILIATGQGWKDSIVFNLIDDKDEQRRFLRCNRSTTIVTTARSPLELPEPREELL